jgi:hypothetical protein
MYVGRNVCLIHQIRATRWVKITTELTQVLHDPMHTAIMRYITGHGTWSQSKLSGPKTRLRNLISALEKL